MVIPKILYASIDVRIHNWDVLPLPEIPPPGNAVAVDLDPSLNRPVGGSGRGLHEKSCSSAPPRRYMPIFSPRFGADFAAHHSREPDPYGHAGRRLHRVSRREA